MNEIGKTPGEVSQTLGVTTATLRNYVKKFGQFLSPDATRETSKRFSPDDIETLKTARSFLHAGMTYKWVQEHLENQAVTGEVLEDFQPETDPQPEPSSEDFQPNDISAIQTREFYERFFKPALDAKDETISELKTDKERLIQEKEQERLEKEKAQRQLNYKNLPFYRQWFSEPPE